MSGSRMSIYTEGVRHKQPIPAAARMGEFLASSLITGSEPGTGGLADNLEDQCSQMFANIRTVIEAAGGSTEDILKVTIWMNDRSQREAINRQWLLMFSNHDSRPARVTLNRELDGGKLIECEILAVLNRDRI